MSTNAALQPSFDEAFNRAKKMDRLRLWMFAGIWGAGALALLFFVWNWSRDLDRMRDQVETVRTSVDRLTQSEAALSSNSLELEKRVKVVSQSASTALGELQTAHDRISEMRTEFQGLVRAQQNQLKQQTEMTDLVRTLQGSLETVRSQSAALGNDTTRIQSILPGLQQQMAGLDSQIARLSTLSDSINQSLGRANDRFGALENEAKQAADKLANIERELQTAHYVFTAHSEYRVWGNDIFVRFEKWRKNESGLTGFCVKASPESECLYGPEFLPLGRTIQLEYNGYRYRITARYGVGMLFAHDQVGFDINRELIKR